MEPNKMTNSESSLPTRWTLIGELKDLGNAPAWREFFERYRHLVYNSALKAGMRPAEAEEVVQETFISVSKRIREFRPSPEYGRFRHWLSRITRFRILDQLRKRLPFDPAGPRSRCDSIRPDTLDHFPDPASLDWESLSDHAYYQSLLDTSIERVKRQVNPEQFQIFDYYVLRQWKASRVAHTLQVSLARVYLAKCRISRLLMKEVNCYSRLGIGIGF